MTDGPLASHIGYRVPKDSRTKLRSTPFTQDQEFTLTGGSETPGQLGRGGKNKAGFNVPPGGCAGKSMNRLGYPSSAILGNPAITQEIDKISFAESLHSERVKSALKAWSSCMHGMNYTYAAEPFSASNDKKFLTPVATQAEIRAATADIACKFQSKLTNIWSSEEASVQRKLIALHQRQLQPVLRQRDVVLSKIKQLSEGKP
ncbi:hypothetical protein ACGFZR_19305 [Streptomyces sp. NPDC048241]|uniref:hypothetical protein n=1 Tax=Streptomyces sp. NPDC048241 TaxID=3365521 RepID=UPI0037213EFA